MHDFFMDKCIHLGEEAKRKGDPAVGALVVLNNVIVGIGMEATKSANDITKHAEIEAIKNALEHIAVGNLSKCDLYTTHEPCIMCAYVIRHYKIRTIIYGMKVGEKGSINSKLKVMTKKDIRSWGTPPKIIHGILEDKCIALSALEKK